MGLGSGPIPTRNPTLYLGIVARSVYTKHLNRLGLNLGNISDLWFGLDYIELLLFDVLLSPFSYSLYSKKSRTRRFVKQVARKS